MIIKSVVILEKKFELEKLSLGSCLRRVGRYEVKAKKMCRKEGEDEDRKRERGEVSLLDLPFMVPRFTRSPNTQPHRPAHRPLKYYV